jgi:hypothetical protein
MDWTETKTLGVTIHPVDVWSSESTKSRSRMVIPIENLSPPSEMEFSSYESTLTKMCMVDFEPSIITIDETGRYKISLEMDVASLTSPGQIRMVMVSSTNKEKRNVPILNSITTVGRKVASTVINLEEGTGIKLIQTNDTILNVDYIKISFRKATRQA